MSKDDMHIVMYKILKYLYECMKVGKDAELKEFCWDSEVCQINKQYWKDIIAEQTAPIRSVLLCEKMLKNQQKLAKKTLKIRIKGV